jgi:hypothetical protein
MLFDYIANSREHKVMKMMGEVIGGDSAPVNRLGMIILSQESAKELRSAIRTAALRTGFLVLQTAITSCIIGMATIVYVRGGHVMPQAIVVGVGPGAMAVKNVFNLRNDFSRIRKLKKINNSLG